MDRIDEITARLAATTPGPWAAGYVYDCADAPEECAGGCGAVREIGVAVPTPNATGLHTTIASCGVEGDAYDAQSRADAHFIAHAPADVAFLLAENAQLRAEREQCRRLAARWFVAYDELWGGDRFGVLLADTDAVARDLYAEFRLDPTEARS